MKCQLSWGRSGAGAVFGSGFRGVCVVKRCLVLEFKSHVIHLLLPSTVMPQEKLILKASMFILLLTLTFFPREGWQ